MISPEFRPETLTAIAAVEAALRLAQRDASAPKVTSKAGRDVVTAADVAVEDAIRAAIDAAHGLPVVGEERGGETPADGSPYWLVDPICGTRNYASGTTLWCVNLALVEDGAVSIGVVGDPSTGDVLVAERGRGAWALTHREPRRLATTVESRTLVVEEGRSTGAVRDRAARFMADAVRADRWDFRSLGTTLSLAYLAAGRISAYVSSSSRRSTSPRVPCWSRKPAAWSPASTAKHGASARTRCSRPQARRPTQSCFRSPRRQRPQANENARPHADRAYCAALTPNV
jgi:myo-inositol-1(or 4)-monophosphatase